MEDTMSKQQFRDELVSARADYDGALAQIPEDRMAEPGVVGEWSAKDVMAHVLWSEREMLGVLRSGKFQGSEYWLLSQDERNARVYEENRHRDLADIQAEAHRVYSELERLIDRLSEEQLNDPSHFEGMPPHLPPWQILMGNTYKHYREHAEDLREWVKRW